MAEIEVGAYAEALAHAKVNLFLEIIEKRPDSYHNLESVFVEIALADWLRVEVIGDKKFSVQCDQPEIPVDGNNLLVKTAERLAEKYGFRSGLRFTLRKCIPTGGGLGGGSSNAASAIKLINALWGLNLPAKDMAGLALQIGSDVPFFLHGGACLCHGRGELIQPINMGQKNKLRIGLIISGIFSSTAAAYQSLSLPGRKEAKSAAKFLAAWAAGNAEGMEEQAFNRFEATVLKDIPKLGEIQRVSAQILSRPVHLSGSGSTLWFFLQPAEPGLNQELQAYAAQNQLTLLATEILSK